MPSEPQSQNSVWYTIALVSVVSLLVAMAVIPALAQNPVPPTAREAAASPAFAPLLTRPTLPLAPGKLPVSVSTRRRSPSPLGALFYENGPVDGTVDAWTINSGYVVSDTYPGGTVSTFDIWVWEFPGDVMTSVDWSITSGPNSGTVYGSGTAKGGNVTDQFVSTNQYGFDIDKISVTGLNGGANGTLYLNLQNAVVPSGDPVYWDENSGQGCKSQGCPSQAYENVLGTIPSEAFDLTGGSVDGPWACKTSTDSPQAVPQQNFQTMYSFSGGADGESPNAATMDWAGNIYGTTAGYCYNGCSGVTAYKLSNRGSGWLLIPLREFSEFVAARTLGPEGALYGWSGRGTDCSDNGCVFNLKPPPNSPRSILDPWMETVLSPLQNNNVPYGVYGDFVFDKAGNLYGSTYYGGDYNFGAIYQLTPANGSWIKTVLYSFSGGSDGQYPSPVVFDRSGNLYGTTQNGGTAGYGTIFQLSPSGGGWTKKTLYNFQDGHDGEWPVAGLTMDKSGNLYGATAFGDNYGATVFKLTPSGADWTFSVIWPLIYNGWTGPVDRLAIDAAGNIYGATTNGCADGRSTPDGGCDLPLFYYGEVFKLTPSDGGWKCTPLHTFNGNDGYAPKNLLLDATGNLYGTTGEGGAYGMGTVWEITP